MSDELLSRRVLLAAAAATPAIPTLLASDRIAIFSPPPERIRIFVTGGTFDKDYNEIAGELYFDRTHLPDSFNWGAAIWMCRWKPS